MMESEPLFESGDDALDRIRGLLHERRNLRTRRAQDDVWDALGRAVGWTPGAGDDAARTLFGACVRDLVKMQATPAEIAARASRYRATYQGAALTPTALVKHWSAMVAPATSNGGLYQSDAFREQEGEPIADLAEAARTARAALERSMAERSSKMEST